LADEFGVSRAQIRDVLGRLEQRGLVRRIPNRGAVVARLDLPQILHIYAVREALEGAAARLAAENAPGESWRDLGELFGAPAERDLRRGDFEAYLAKLELLRRRMLEGAGNPVLADLLENILDRTRMIIRRVLILPGRAATGLREHRAVLQALRRGDGAAAEAATRHNIRSGLAYLRRYESFVL
jgi:DNA-binding GntR family transcriptional regulator